MGGSSSTETPKTVVPVQQVVEQERKPELLKEPWRDVQWTPSTKANLMQSLREYKPTIDSVPQARILLIGAVGAGKSSFFNSINSIFRGNITGQAKAGDMGTSLTLKYRIYKVRAGRGKPPMAFLLCDTMGLEPTVNGGLNIEDIVGILKGYIPDKYCFNPVSPWQPGIDQERGQLQIKNKIHCVVYVIDGSSPGLLHPDTRKKVDDIRKKSDFNDVPLIVLVTKVDKACPYVEKDLKNVYRSRYIRDLIKKASDCLGIAESNVLPVKNYSHEIELNDTFDILLLRAMKQILNFADDYIDSVDEDQQ